MIFRVSLLALGALLLVSAMASVSAKVPAPAEPLTTAVGNQATAQLAQRPSL
jgi:hypothetical protein